VCRYNWHSAGSLDWPFPMLKYKYIFHIKYTEAILSYTTRKLLWFEITKMPTAVLRDKFIVLFIIIFGTLSFVLIFLLRPTSTVGRRDGNRKELQTRVPIYIIFNDNLTIILR